MNARIGDADDLLATLSAAEASLRAVAAEALSPAALMRAERQSTRAARQAMSTLAAARVVVLEPGFSEFVEVDEALDALLTRYQPLAAAPLPAPAAPAPRRAAVAAAPAPVPVAAVAEDPLDGLDEAEPEVSFADTLDDDFAYADDLPYTDDDASPSYATVAVEEERPTPLPTALFADEEGEAEDEENTVIASGASIRTKAEALKAAAAASPPAEEATAPADAPAVYADDDDFAPFDSEPAAASFVVFETDDEDEDEYYAAEDDGGGAYDPEESGEVQYVAYVEPDPLVVPLQVEPAEEELPDYARRNKEDKEGTSPSVQVPGAARLAEKRAQQEEARRKAEAEAKERASQLESSGDEWAFLGDEHDDDPAPSAGTDRYAEFRGEKMRLDDFTTVASKEDFEVEEEDEHTAVTGTPRTHAAAIQLAADGSGRVLGDVPDDPDDGSVIELGDTQDYGDEEIIDDDQTGILGIGVVEYDDDVDDADDVEDLPEIDPGLGSLPGAPELTPAEVSALYARAQDVSRRNMVDGTLLFGDVLDADPKRVDALLARGRLHLDLGDFPSAASDFLKAEALQPRDPDGQVALGDLFQSRKDYGKAVSYYNRALELDDQHALALARRGMAFYYRRQFNAAVEDLEKAKKLDASIAHVDTYIARARKRT